jgi:hypothetical protein
MDLRERLSIGVILFALLWLAGQASFIIREIPFGVLPDEGDHWILVQYWLQSVQQSSTSNIPTGLGPINQFSPLYYWVAVKLLNLLSPDNPQLFLRYFSLALGVAFLCLTYIYIRVLSHSWVSAAAGVVVLENTFVFVYMS